MEKRLYSLVIYNISSIQAGIQSAHSNMEYALKYWNDKDFQDWAKNWKTIILLNGGITNSGKETYYNIEPKKGTMEKYLEIIQNMDIKVVPFYEPDLNFSLTSMSFLVDERVFNREKYPDPVVNINSWREFQSKKSFEEAINYKFNDLDISIFYDWIQSIGGEKNLFLRFFLKDFRLANN